MASSPSRLGVPHRGLRLTVTGRAPTSPAACIEPPPGRAPTVTTADAGRGRATSINTCAVLFAKCRYADGVVDAGGSSEAQSRAHPAIVDGVFFKALHSSPSPAQPGVGASGPKLCTPPGTRPLLDAGRVLPRPGGAAGGPPSRRRAAFRAHHNSCGSAPLPLRGGRPKKAQKYDKPSASGLTTTPYVPLCARRTVVPRRSGATFCIATMSGIGRSGALQCRARVRVRFVSRDRGVTAQLDLGVIGATCSSGALPRTVQT